MAVEIGRVAELDIATELFGECAAIPAPTKALSLNGVDSSGVVAREAVPEIGNQTGLELHAAGYKTVLQFHTDAATDRFCR